MNGQDGLARLQEAFAGAYPAILRSTVHVPGQSCSVCRCPVNGYDACYPCAVDHARSGVPLADRAAFIVYAMATEQSGHMMRSYKARTPARQNRLALTALLILTVAHHLRCPERLGGAPLTGWAFVPSLSARIGPHPLEAVCEPAMGLYGGNLHRRIDLQPGDQGNPRQVSAAHFIVGTPVSSADHLLLVDDTWTRGGHAQSAAAALKLAGTAQVSLLVVARWIGATWKQDADWVHGNAPAYRPQRCPWTGDGACP